MKKSIFIVIFTGLLAGYQTPSNDIVRIYDAPRTPSITNIAFTPMAFETYWRAYSTIEELAEPMLELAGIRFSPRIHAELASYPDTAVFYIELGGNKRVRLDSGEHPIRTFRASHDRRRVAMVMEQMNGLGLEIVDLDTGSRRAVDILLNGVVDITLEWLPGGDELIVLAVPENQGRPPVKKITEPRIEETTGSESRPRTYTNLLKDQYDAELFEYYATSRIVLIDAATGKAQPIGQPSLFTGIDISPDGKYIVVETIEKPFSFAVPYYYFPKSIDIIDMKGQTVRNLVKRPLQDQIPIGGTYQGPRYHQWQPLEDATIVWAEALDGGDPRNKATFRDVIKSSAFPFYSEKEMFQTIDRYAGIDWSEIADEYIYYEYDRDSLWSRGWLVDIAGGKKLVHDMSSKEKYDDPGELIDMRTPGGKRVFLHREANLYFLNNEGATPEGNRPFMARMSVETGELEELYRCGSDSHERIYGFADSSLTHILVRRETTTSPRNYLLIDLATGKETPITDYPNPYPQLTAIEKRLVTYDREDSIPLSGILYLPPVYNGQDKLPVVIEAYPTEFTDASTAGQVSGSPNAFPSFWGADIRYFLLHGYAVLSNASIPIVGDPETVNNTFIEQTLKSVEAAINFLSDEGIADRNRIGIIGHSYGAFMVANVLANSDLCQTGIAKSGAYNRTLTPFGFQHERRTLWEAKDFYTKVSPFIHADSINEPLLLIHGAEDPNPGTYPMQSERMYSAIKGNSGTARLVILPHEGHGYRARESQLHVIWEMLTWFDEYLKPITSDR